MVLATHNQGKVREIAHLMEGLDVEWLCAADFPNLPKPEETESTLEGNAQIKAKALSDALGLPALAEDSGLFVDALNGEPGVHSARYAGPACNDADNVLKLLADMVGKPKDERGAAFRTVAALLFPGEDLVFLKGEVRGLITENPKGMAGFGYDPVFQPEGETRVFAEMTLEEKNAISHRARAMAKVREWLEKRLKG
jgi:XTP/dITP diphosphohydrolase